MIEIRPFRIDVPQADLADLHERLGNVRWSAQLPGKAWERVASRSTTCANWRAHIADIRAFFSAVR
ncbi:hypothetical protein OHB26_14775 [Nocardia sp. NBC_01503]|uniref:epoxide hydrolase N-terminal domain-containing protein n=1 Tax=Nocardia sp. NBC_01503 TaxID=2975997 RepID=UPI002E7AFD0A|nr:epoxide hydrolase N-terminal domain-containing protein [Nocardia sp. NBC_01503]WTL35340.1 hypothetical protein OHB26_14775 [Nocardia sp. NBC_01503]